MTPIAPEGPNLYAKLEGLEAASEKKSPPQPSEGIITNIVRNVEKLESLYDTDTMKKVWRFFKLKLKLPHDSATPLLGIYPKEMKQGLKKDIHMPMLITALFTIAKR
jgi:hypothetical protein